MSFDIAELITAQRLLLAGAAAALMAWYASLALTDRDRARPLSKNAVVARVFLATFVATYACAAMVDAVSAPRCSPEHLQAMLARMDASPPRF